MKHQPQNRSKRRLLATSLLCGAALTGAAVAQDDAEDVIEVVGSNLDALPVENVGSVFGFGKNLVETPRSVSTISAEQIERFGIDDIYGLVAQSPGTFTNSFFGVGGALDIRGQAGEVYFRGVRRLDNPGNYPTPIGASDRIDIVRGPASPIFGPSKSGGYMNFVPKTARLAGGALMAEPSGEVRYTGGSWDKSVLAASLTGPAEVAGQEFGYHLYAEIEDSGSYYRYMGTEQVVLQASFDTYLSDSLRLEFGAMYHDFDGQQNGGWNRLTQDLVDNGTYITGTAQALDLDGDGQLSPEEFNAFDSFSPSGFNVFGSPPAGCDDFFLFAANLTDECLSTSYSHLALENTGTTTLSRRNVLTGEDDLLTNEDLVLYFDTIYEAPSGLEIKNQMFYEAYENFNENDYGFSQFHDSWVFENKVVVSQTFDVGFADIATQFSPSIRNTEFRHGDDYTYEYFHRVDLTESYTARSDRLLSNESGVLYDNWVKGEYLNYGAAGLVDATFDFGLSALVGLRYDYLRAKSLSVGQYELRDLGTGPDIAASGNDDAVSWNTSISYETPIGIIPYFTLAEQSVVIAGQGAEIGPSDIAGNSWVTATEMREFGVKGSFLDDTLYAAVSYFEQERTDRNIQSITVNQDIKTEGIEAEARWAVSDQLLITAAYTNLKVINQSILESGTQFSFFGIEDLINVSDPTSHLGAQPIGLVPISSEDDARRAGIPENLFSFTGTYEFDSGLSVSGSMVAVESVFSGQSQVVKLPGYTTVDLSASYPVDNWLFRATVKNATNEEYFRANFTELFGSTIVLPEKPRSVQASVIYKF